MKPNLKRNLDKIETYVYGPSSDDIEGKNGNRVMRKLFF